MDIDTEKIAGEMGVSEEELNTFLESKSITTMDEYRHFFVKQVDEMIFERIAGMIRNQ